MKNLKALGLALILAMTGLLTACDTDGPAEQAGETIDEAVEETGEKAEEAAEETQEAAEDAQENVKEATN